MSLVKACLGVFVISSMGNIRTAACSKNFGGHDAHQCRVEGHHFRPVLSKSFPDTGAE